VSEVNDKKEYRTRIVTTANKVNLKLEEAQEQMFTKLSELATCPLFRRSTETESSQLNKRRGAVKSLLLSQDIIAGMGNLYVDETLYRASIHPRRAVDTLSDAEVKSIFTCMRAILKEAITFKSRGGDYPGRWLTQHREEGETCPMCRGTIQRTVVFGRTTYFCGTHQKA